MLSGATTSSLQSRSLVTGVVHRLMRSRCDNAAMFAFFWGVILLGSYSYNKIFNPWWEGGFNTNDWLINYGGGFVRRGLFGQLLIEFHRVIPVLSLTRELQLIQIGFLFAAGLVFTLLAHRVSHRWLPWVFLSPAGLLWSAYDRRGGLRKEIILIIALGLLALACRHSSRRVILWANAVAALLAALTIFSWEASIVLAPTLALLQWRSLAPLMSARQRRVVVATTSGFLVVAFGLASTHRGSIHNILGMCRGLRQAGMNTIFTCRPSGKVFGEFTALTSTIHAQIHLVSLYLPRNWFYGFWLILALFPFMASGWLRRWWPFALGQFAVTIPLYVIGTDWGRWVHLFIISLTIMWLATISTTPKAELGPRGTIESAGLLAWTTCWGFSYYFYPFWIGGFFALLKSAGIMHFFKQL